MTDGPRLDEAVFATARVRAGGGRGGMIVGVTLAVALGSLATAGLLNGRPTDRPVTGAADAMRDVPANRVIPAPGSTSKPAGDSSLVLHTRAWGRYVFVHGDVLTLATEFVVVSIVDPDGDLVETRTVDEPEERFELSFELDGLAATEIAYVQANAFDTFGHRIASERQTLDPPVDPGWWRGDTTSAAAPIVRSGRDGDLTLAIRRQPAAILVEGLIGPAGATGVFVQLVNSEGLVTGWSQLSLPRVGPPGRGQIVRFFDTVLGMPDRSHGPLWIQVNAYDATGAVVAREQLGVWPDGTAMLGSTHPLADPAFAPLPDAVG